VDSTLAALIAQIDRLTALSAAADVPEFAALKRSLSSLSQEPVPATNPAIDAE